MVKCRSYQIAFDQHVIQHQTSGESLVGRYAAGLTGSHEYKLRASGDEEFRNLQGISQIEGLEWLDGALVTLHCKAVLYSASDQGVYPGDIDYGIFVEPGGQLTSRNASIRWVLRACSTPV